MTTGDVIILSDSVRISGPLEIGRIQNPDNLLIIDSRLDINGHVHINGQLWADQGSLRLINHDNLPSGDENDDRRALFHSPADQLIVNFLGEYTGGTRVDGKLVANDGLDVNGQLSVKQGSLGVVNNDNLPSEDENKNRRALLHGSADQLIVNYTGEYTGGTKVVGKLVAIDGLDVKGQLSVKEGSLGVVNNDNLPSEDENENRRALFHGTDDQLIVNYAGEYTGGTKVESSLNVNGDLDVNGGLAVNVDEYEWPLWPGQENKSPSTGEPVPDIEVEEHLDLIREIHRMKQEILSLRAEVDSLTKSKATPEAL